MCIEDLSSEIHRYMDILTLENNLYIYIYIYICACHE